MQEERGDLRGAALDAGRAARLLRTRLQQDPEEAERLGRVVRALRRQGELLARAPPEADEERAAWRAAVRQLAERYGSRVQTEAGLED